MKIAKRIMALCMVIALCFSLLAACGKKGTGGTSSTGPAIAYTGGTTKSQTDLFGNLEGTKLRIADDNYIGTWEEIFYEQFAEITGMEIEIEHMGSNELATKIAQAVASGDKRNYFDVGICANSTLINIVYSNLATPMDPYVYYDDPVWKYDSATNFNSLDLYKIDGKIWGAPSNGFHENFIFYNRTYFQEVGAPDPYEEYYLKDNWTFETFLDTCEAVTRKDADGNVEIAAWATWNYFTFCSAAGNDLIEQNADGEWEVVFDQPDGMAGLDVFYESCINDYVLKGSSGYSEFVNRKVAMLIEKPSSAISGTNAYTRMNDEVAIVPFPKMNAEQEKYICPMIVSGYYIAACSQNPLGAAAYIYYHKIGEVNNTKSEEGAAKILANQLNAESQERRNEYIAKCDFAVSFVDGLAGWYGDVRDTFLDVMRVDNTNPATTVDSIKGLMKDSLRRTVG